MNSVQPGWVDRAHTVAHWIWRAGLILVVSSVPVSANAAPGPREIVEDTANRMIEIIHENRQALVDDSQLLYGFVSEIILPHLDFETASRSILGKHWKPASPDQRARFAEEFKTMLVRTYAKALLEYQDERLEFFPAVPEKDPTRATVEARFYQPGADPIPIKYRMHNRKGGWQVWDVSIAGISVVASFRNVFSSDIRERGLDGVIEDLAARNSSGA